MSKKFDRLLKKVKETDLSINNSEMQAVIEHAVADWVKSYTEKKESKYPIYDRYGGPGEIPEKISVNGEICSPPQILEHVIARDEIGIIVINQIHEYQKQHPRWFGNDFGKMLTKMNKNLDKCFIYYACSHDNQTVGDVMQGIIHPNKRPMFVIKRLEDAIMKWYGAPWQIPNLDTSKKYL